MTARTRIHGTRRSARAATGNDKLLGNVGARLDGGAGADVIYGASGNDRYFTADDEIDQLFGGSGTDAAKRDPNDVLASVEALLP